MEKVKLFIVISIALLSALVVGVILKNLSENDTSRVINDVEQSLGTSQQNQNSSEPLSGSAAVTIQNHTFGPGKVTVKKGTKVTWTNRDSDEHDVTPDVSSSVFQKSELLGRGDSYSVTFSETGTYTYHCSPHEYMTGTVEVVE